MTFTPTRQPEVGEASDSTELLIREARAASRRRRQRVLVIVIAVLVATMTGILAIGNGGPSGNVNAPVNNEPRSLGVAKTSPYPATLKMQHGMYEGGGRFPSPTWGSVIAASQSRWINIKSSRAIDEWGVWQPNGDGGLYPVRSTDGGVRWTAAGPLLATDWVGGGIYYVSKVISDGPSSVVMTNGAVIDVTTDGGHQWYQYLNPAGEWIVSGQPVSVSIGIRIRPFPNGDLPKGSYATYVLNDARHEWVRTSESVGAQDSKS
jgi:hypothetical protein